MGGGDYGLGVQKVYVRDVEVTVRCKSGSGQGMQIDEN